MKNYIYYLLAAFWILLCVLLGWYVRGTGFTGKQQQRLGIKAIVVFYLLGLVFLFIAIGLS